MNRDRYRSIVRGFPGRTLVVLGDLMMDEYVWGQASRVSPESPVMVVDVERETSVPGGAANVVNNLLALGARVRVVGVVGDDAAGRALRGDLAARGATVDGVVTDPTRPTTRKTRVVARSQQVLRVDREQTRPLTGEVERQLLGHLSLAVETADALIVSDYNKGVLTPVVAACALDGVRRARGVLSANAKPPNARALTGADVVQLNRAEAEMTSALLGLASLGAGAGEVGAVTPHRFTGDDGLEEAGAALRQALGVGTLVVTRGSLGLSLWGSSGAVHHIPAHPVEVYDEAGAGDTVISALTLSMTAGAGIEDAAAIANRAAACVIRKVGVATVTADELLSEW